MQTSSLTTSSLRFRLLPRWQLVRLCLHPKGLQPYISNWEVLVASFLARARRALMANPKDDRLPIIINEILSHPNAPKDWQQVWSASHSPAIEMSLHKDDKTYRLFTMIAHFGGPTDVTLEELSVEMFYPADEETKQLIEQL